MGDTSHWVDKACQLQIGTCHELPATDQQQGHLPSASGGSDSKKICLQCERHGFDPQVGRIPWRRVWQPSPVFLPGESPWTEAPDGLQSMGSQRVRHNSVIKHSMYKICLNSWSESVSHLLSHVWLLAKWIVAQQGCSVHEILQAGILEWVAIHFSRGMTQESYIAGSTYIAGRFFTHKFIQILKK